MIEVSETGLKELMQSLENAADNIPREIYSALGTAGTKTKSAMTKEVAKELNVKQKIIRDQVKTKKDRQNLLVTISLVKSIRIPLRDFGAKSTRRKGVTAKISKSKGSRPYPNAFQVTKIGNHIFKRSGSQRLPITKLHGPSPWGVLAKNPEKVTNVVEIAREAVIDAIRKRIRYLELKKRGGLNWQQNENETTDTSEG